MKIFGKRDGLLSGVLHDRKGRQWDAMAWYAPWHKRALWITLAALLVIALILISIRPFVWRGWRFAWVRLGWPQSQMRLVSPARPLSGEVELPQSFCLGFTQCQITEIDPFALVGSMDLASLPADRYRNYGAGLKKVRIPEGIQRIGHGAFYGCAQLEEVDLPDTVEYLGNRAFAFCRSLRQIHLPQNLQTLGESTFVHNQGLQAVFLPDGLTCIGRFSFVGCTSLKTIHFPDGLKTIEWGAFEECQSLERLTFPDSLEEIGDYAFVGCSSLKEVSLPQGCQIGPYTFPRQTKVHYRKVK